MKRSLSMCSLGLAIAMASSACGDNTQPPAPLRYTNPTAGALRLIKDDQGSTDRAVMLDLVVGDGALTGYAAGFDLPLDASDVKLAVFTPGPGLDPGSAPVAALAKIPELGPLQGNLVTVVSQKAAGVGAITTDTVLAPGTALCSLRLDLLESAHAGVVFDGTADGFVLPSGGLRNKAGLTVVEPKDVGIGKLEVVY